MITKLDTIDLKILQILQKSGRMTNVDLAKRVGISAPPCLRRLKNLEDGGLFEILQWLDLLTYQYLIQ